MVNEEPRLYLWSSFQSAALQRTLYLGVYFLPGTKNATIQLTLFNFIGRYSSSYNLLFANVIMITLPMLVLFLFFNKRIVDGMVAGSVKG